MADSNLAKKLRIKPGQRVLALNAPEGFIEGLRLPEGVELSRKPRGKFDVVQVFSANRQEFDDLIPVAVDSLGPKGILWVAYPKQTAKLKTDLNRDVLHEHAATKGLEGVSLVSVDDTWSSMRFKRM